MILLIWTLLGVVVYQFTVLRPWAKTHPDEIWLSDMVKGLFCGPNVIIVVCVLLLLYNDNVTWNK